MENKQTAVDWLINELTKKRKYYINNAILPIFKNSLQEREINKLLEQAKEMEKEQHGLTFARGYMSGYAGANGHESVDFDKYYEKQYGN